MGGAKIAHSKEKRIVKHILIKYCLKHHHVENSLTKKYNGKKSLSSLTARQQSTNMNYFLSSR